jgi:predicted DNA-binding transcriptional regulator AlpA
MRELLSTLQAARYCGLSPRTLEKMRTTGAGPRFIKLGRAVKYALEDLDQWIAGNRRRSTSDPGDQGGEAADALGARKRFER